MIVATGTEPPIAEELLGVIVVAGPGELESLLPEAEVLIVRGGVFVTNPPYGVRMEESGVWRGLESSGRRVVALSPTERPGSGWRKLLTTQNGGLRVHFVERESGN